MATIPEAPRWVNLKIPFPGVILIDFQSRKSQPLSEVEGIGPLLIADAAEIRSRQRLCKLSVTADWLGEKIQTDPYREGARIVFPNSGCYDLSSCNVLHGGFHGRR